MAAWCAENLRDLEGWRASGLALSTASNECAKLFDGALRQLVSWSDCDTLGGLLKTLENMTTADPQAVLPRAFRLGLEALGTNTCTRVNKALKNSLEQLQKDAEEYGNEREKKHAKAVILYADGHIRAATNIWEEILAEYPTDMMALKFAQDGYFFIGDINGKRDSVQAVLPKYKGTEPCYSYLYGMQAFGLEECEQYDEAEKSALKALNLNRFDCWATHARAHCMIMQGRISQGIDMMESTVDDWKRGWIIATHNYWHKALFYLEKGDFETSLTIFDDEICRRFNSSKNVLDLADCASLLWRLEMEGVDVGKSHSDEDNTKVCRDVGVPLYEGIRHFAKGQYDMAVEKMLPIRHELYRIGGSNAQRDVFIQTLIQACIMSKKPEHFNQTTMLLEERNALNKNSTVGERLAAKFRKYHPL